MRTKLALAVGLAAVAAITTTTPAHASDTVRCGFETNLSYTNGGADFSSQPGTLNCVGEANGRLTMGVGTVRLTGTAGAADGESCALGAGSGTVEMSIPQLFSFFDPDPYTPLEGAFEYHHAASVWEAQGTVSGASGDSGLAIVGVEQASCALDAAKTASTLSGEIVVGGAAAASNSPATAPCANSIPGSAKADRLRGTSSEDLLSGFGGRDRISAKSGADCIFGGNGVDVLRGGKGRDAIHCGAGADVVHADHADKVAPNCEKVRSH